MTPLLCPLYGANGKSAPTRGARQTTCRCLDSYSCDNRIRHPCKATLPTSLPTLPRCSQRPSSPAPGARLSRHALLQLLTLPNAAPLKPPPDAARPAACLKLPFASPRGLPPPHAVAPSRLLARWPATAPQPAARFAPCPPPPHAVACHSSTAWILNSSAAARQGLPNVPHVPLEPCGVSGENRDTGDKTRSNSGLVGCLCSSVYQLQCAVRVA